MRIERAVIVCLCALAVAGCDRLDTPPWAYRHVSDRISAVTRVVGFGWPCTRLVMDHGALQERALSPDECYVMGPVRTMRGAWLVALETSRFFPDAEDTATVMRRLRAERAADGTSGTWLATRDRDLAEGLYLVELAGQRTAYPGGYGQWGLSRDMVVVRQFYSIRLLRSGPLPD